LACKLTKEQSDVVYCDDKLIAVSACPGSGKTRTLVARAVRLWNETPHKILICTFSRAAVDEVKARLDSDYSGRIEVRTLHSLAYQIVRENWSELTALYGNSKWPAEPVLVTREQEIALLQEVFPGTDTFKILDGFEKLRSYCTHPSLISKLSKKGLMFGRFKQLDIDLWATYERERHARGLINFDDMIYLAGVLVGDPLVSGQLMRKFDHILLDEAQDTSEAEWAILRPMMAGAETTLVVGDYNQAIFGFRQADGSVLRAFDNIMSATCFKLTESFRLGSKIAQFSNKIVRDKSYQVSLNEKQASYAIHKFATIEEERDFVLSHLPGSGTFAILSRTHSYLEQFERELIKKGIHFIGNSFYRSPHIVEMTKELVTVPEALLDQTVKALFQDNQKYDKHVRADFERARNIIKTQGFTSFKTCVDFALSGSDSGITIGTGHSSKGAEWETVFVVGAHEGHIPHRHSTDLAEEHNLMYVMCTRASRKLSISYVGAISRFLK